MEVERSHELPCACTTPCTRCLQDASARVKSRPSVALCASPLDYGSLPDETEASASTVAGETPCLGRFGAVPGANSLALAFSWGPRASTPGAIAPRPGRGGSWAQAEAIAARRSPKLRRIQLRLLLPVLSGVSGPPHEVSRLPHPIAAEPGRPSALTA